MKVLTKEELEEALLQDGLTNEFAKENVQFGILAETGEDCYFMDDISVGGARNPLIWKNWQKDYFTVTEQAFIKGCMRSCLPYGPPYDAPKYKIIYLNANDEDRTDEEYIQFKKKFMVMFINNYPCARTSRNPELVTIAEYMNEVYGLPEQTQLSLFEMEVE